MIRINRLIISQVFFTFIFVILASIYGFDAEVFLSICAVYSVVFFLKIIVENRQNILKPSILLFLISFIYNYGELWLRSINIELPDSSFSYIYFEKYLVNESFFYITIFLLLAYLFLLIYESNAKVIAKPNLYSSNLDSIIKIAIWPLAIMAILYDFNIIINGIRYGYLASLTARSSSEILVFGNYAFIFCSLFMIIKNDFRKNSTAVLLSSWLIIKSLLSLFFVGTRMLPFAIILTLIIIAYKNKKMNLKRMVLFILIAFILISIADFAYDNRHNVGEMANIFSLRNGAVSTMLYEMGQSFVDIPLIMKNIDNIGGCCYGMTYATGVLTMIPGIGRVFPDIVHKYSSISALLNPLSRKGMGLGGSLYGELFYNFEWYSLFVSIFIGWLFARIDFLVEEKDDIFKTASGLYLFLIMVQYIRGTASDVTGFFRVLFYFFIIALCFREKNKYAKEIKADKE